MTVTRKHKKPKRKSTPKTNIMHGVGSYSRPGPRRLKGRGGYAEDIGGRLGSWLGQKAGSLFKSITGLGTYNVRQNTLVAKPSDPPIVSNTNSGTRIQHREYIQDISGTTAFAIQSFPVNPGMSETFPWLCSVANAFEEYRLHGILFEFKSTSASALNSTNTALGTVIMATEYNPLHGNFTAKRDMENYVYSTSSPPDQSALHPIECARDVSVLDELFIRNVPLTGADLRFSDIGNFQIATIGMQAAAVIGELWVTYDVELLKPKLPDAFSSIGPSHYYFSNGATVAPSPTVGPPTVANLFGTTTAFTVLKGTGVSPCTLNATTMTFKQTGRYMAFLQISGTGAVIGTANAALVNSAGLAIQSYNGTLNALVQNPPSGVTANSAGYCITFDITAQNGTVNWQLATIPASVNSLDLWVIPLPIGFTTPIPTEQEVLYKMITDMSVRLDRLNALAIDCEDEPEEKEYYTPNQLQFEPESPPCPPSSARLIRTEPRSIVTRDMTASTASLASALLSRLTSTSAA